MTSGFIRWSDERLLYHSSTLSDIEEKAKKLGLDADKILELFLILLDRGFLKGRSTVVVEAACFLVYIRQNDLPIPDKTIIEMFGVEREKVYATYKAILSTLNIKIQPPSIESKIHYVASKLNLDANFVNEALQVVNNCRDLLQGKRPSVVAAAIVWYLAKKHGIRVTQTQLADILYVTEAGIREVVRALKKLHCV